MNNNLSPNTSSIQSALKQNSAIMQTDVDQIIATNEPNTQIYLMDFFNKFKDVLLDSLNQSIPPVYKPENAKLSRLQITEQLTRQPFAKQAEVVQTITALLIVQNEPATIINADMGTGKTMMLIDVATILHEEGYKRTLV